MARLQRRAERADAGAARGAGGEQPLPGLGPARGQPAENPRHLGAGNSRHVGRHLVQVEQGENCGRRRRQGIGLNAQFLDSADLPARQARGQVAENQAVVEAVAGQDQLRAGARVRQLFGRRGGGFGGEVASAAQHVVDRPSLRDGQANGLLEQPDRPGPAVWFWALGAVTAGLTAFYMFRMFFNTFHGECRASEEVKHHIHESPKVMTIPLMVLAVLSIIGGYVGVPHLLGGSNHIEKWLEPVVGHHAPAAATHSGGFGIVSTAFASAAEGHGAETSAEMQLMIGAIIIGLLGIFIAWLFYMKNPNIPKRFVEKFHGLFTLVHNKYFVDELYGFIFVKGLFKLGKVCKDFFDETIIDGIINGIAAALSGIGSLIRKIQSGFVQGYAFAIIFGAIIVIGYLISRIL